MRPAEAIGAEAAERVVAAERRHEVERHARAGVGIVVDTSGAPGEDAPLGEEADELPEVDFEALNVKAPDRRSS